MRNKEHRRPRKKFEDGELQALLDEDDTETQQQFVDQLSVTLEAVSIHLKAMESCEDLSTNVDAKVLKQEVIKCLEDGFKLSQIQARQAFGQYLQRVLMRMSGHGSRAAGKQRIDDGHSELVLRFLQRAGHNLRSPFHLKTPSRNLQGKDRIAVIAKQLSDFLYLYNRETDSLPTCSNENRQFIPNRLFTLFLPVAKESDLEEVLTLNTKLYKCAQVFLGRCGPSPHKLNSLGLLQSIGKGHGPQDKVSGCECSAVKKSLPQILGSTSQKESHAPQRMKVARAL
ncbi:tubulin polyglutamylase TTLL5-like [Lycorma delicatula]|uniref:tubulin polyglutamylase TTLL5-like n=1 Tax=Lycorma delicatula TaxID=130591 RepID=UPI003F50DB0C